MAIYGTGSNVNQTVSVNAATYGNGGNNYVASITVDGNKRISAINTSSITATLASNSTVGTVGSYAFMQQSSGNTQYAPGATLAGSSLRYSDATGQKHSDTPSGNWRCMGYDSGAALTNAGSVSGPNVASASGSFGSGNIQGDITVPLDDFNVTGNTGTIATDDLNFTGNTGTIPIDDHNVTGNVQGNNSVNYSGNIQGGKGGSFSVNRTIPVDDNNITGNIQGDTSTTVSGNIQGDTSATISGNIQGNQTIATDDLNVAGNVSVNVNLNSVTVNTVVAYSSTLWLRYS